MSFAVTGANRHDASQLEAVLAAIMVERPQTQYVEASIWVPTVALPQVGAYTMVAAYWMG